MNVTEDLWFELTLTAAIGTILTGMSVVSAKRGYKIDLFSPPIILATTMLIQYYVPAFVLSINDYWLLPHTKNISAIILDTIFLSAVSWSFFLIGYHLSIGKNVWLNFPSCFYKRFDLTGSFILVILGLISSLIVLIRSGGLLAVSRAGSVTKGTGIFVYLSLLILPGQIKLWVDSKYQKRFFVIVTLLFYFIFLTVSQARGGALNLMIYLFITSYYMWNIPNKTVGILAIFFAVFIIGFGATTSLLTSSANYASFWDFLIRVNSSIMANITITIGRSISRLEQVAIIIEVIPYKIPFFMGEPMLMSVFGPFGKYIYGEKFYDWRVILTGLAYSGSDRISSYSVYYQSLSWDYNMGGTAVGELYANFDWIGVWFGWLLLGILGGGIYEWFQNQTVRKAALPIYLMILRVFWGMIGEGMAHIFNLWLLLPLVLMLGWEDSRKAMMRR
ncbi:MAG: hypothetical protein AB4352_27240 [Hormoscilla sp.]